MSRSRGWCFTINNWTHEDNDQVSDLFNVTGARYVIWGEEGKTTDTPHLQGFVYFNNPFRLQGVKKLLPRAHLEPMKGTPAQAAEYCRKEADFQFLGEEPISSQEKGAKEKRRYEIAWEQAQAGDLELIDADIRVRLYGTLKKIRADYQPTPANVDVFDFWWFVGESGTGKSHTARAENPGELYLKEPNQWWDGYAGEDVVLIEEWGKQHFHLADKLKKWADHYPFRCEVKGACLVIRPKKLIVTSNYTIEECFPCEGDHLPLLRRFQVRKFGQVYSSGNDQATSTHFVT